MTKLARLIAELCPNGVEYKTLGDVCSLITKGTTPSAFEKKGVSFIKTEAIDGLKIDKRKLSFINQSIHEEDLKRSILQENDILFAIAGSIGKCAVITKDLLPANTNQALAIIRLIESVNRNYILHMLQSQYMKEYIFRSVKGSAQPNLNLQQMNNFPIPIPPIPIQQEIVRILDKFTQLETEIEVQLTAELEARKKQYEYYRNTLLTFDEESTILKTSRPADQQTSRPADQQTSRPADV